MDREGARRVVYEAIDVVNHQLPRERRLAKSPDTVIVGAGGPLDSLGIVTFVVALEEKASDALGRPVTLLDDALTLDADVRVTVDRFADQIAGLSNGSSA